MKYVITGASGFVGGHLIDHICRSDPGPAITCLDLIEPDYSYLEQEIRASIQFIKADLLTDGELLRIIGTARPDFIIHLASFSSVAYSWQHPIESFRNNSNIFLNLLEAVRAVNPGIRILGIGSSEQYGSVLPERMPLKETDPQNPVSPYAVARVAQELMASVYVKGFGLDIVSTRSFNHFGPRQDDRFVLSGLARQAADIKKGKAAPVICTGNLDIVRDFTDVRDVVRAYLFLLKRGATGEVYNVCNGTGRTIGECLETLLGIAGINCEIKKSDELLRPVDNPIIVGDNARIKDRTGWSPKITFDTGLTDLFAYWMAQP